MHTISDANILLFINICKGLPYTDYTISEDGILVKITDKQFGNIEVFYGKKHKKY